MMLRNILIVLFIALNIATSAQPANDTFSLYFELGVPELSRKTIAKLDSLLYEDVINTSSKLVIVGYADFLGSEESNKSLSEERSLNVLAHLVSMGINKSNVQLCIGKGEIDRSIKTKDGYPVDRRVDVVLDKKRMIKKPVSIAAKPGAAPVVPKPSPTVPIKRSVPPTVTGIDISALKPGQTMVLENLYFYPGRHIIREESISVLEKLYVTLEENPDLKIQIEGHVCCVNTIDALDEDNFQLALSLNRAKYIYLYLIKHGIESERLSYKGFGKSRPVVQVEKTAEDEDKNRRVEIRIIE